MASSVHQMEDSFNHSMEVIVGNTFQQSNQLKDSILRKGRSVNEHISMLSGFTKNTVSRIHLFRDVDKHRKTIKNSILSKLRSGKP